MRQKQEKKKVAKEKVVEVKTRPMVTPKISIQADVSKDDIIAVAVSREEESLLKRSDELKAEIKKVEKDNAATCKETTRLYKELGELKFKALATAALKAIEKVGAEDFVAVVNFQGVDRDGNLSYTVGVGGKGDSRSYSQGFSVSKSIAKTSKIKSLEKKSKEDDEKACQLSSQLIGVKKQLSRLSSMERRVKAKLAEALLNRTDEGKALLDSIKGVKSLPLPE